MCLQCTEWVFGGHFIHFLAMYLQCTCWVHRPLPPVIGGIQEPRLINSVSPGIRPGNRPLVGLELLGGDKFVVVGRVGDLRHSGRR